MVDAYVRLALPSLSELCNFKILRKTKLPRLYTLVLGQGDDALVGRVTKLQVDTLGARFSVAFGDPAAAARRGFNKVCSWRDIHRDARFDGHRVLRYFDEV